MLKEGDNAPEFSLAGIDEEGVEREFRLSSLLSGPLENGRDIALYFYPKDDTPGCTVEACDFRDNFSRAAASALVLGVSADSIASHLKFKARHGLNFPLLSDPDHKVMRKYGAWGQKKTYGKTVTGIIRTTCLIAPDGTIARIWRGVKVKGHVDAVLETLSARGRGRD